MTKTEFLQQLAVKLNKYHVADAGEVIKEYEEHFRFKIADGFSEEEIAARLGDPAALALQFGSIPGATQSGGGKIVAAVGLTLADLFAGAIFILLFAWGVVMAAFSLVSLTLSLCLLLGTNIHGLVPPMPYWNAAVFGVTTAALALLAAVGCVYFMAFLRQLVRSYRRFHHNVFVAASGGAAVLPALAVYPQPAPRVRRRLRLIGVVAFAVFAASFVLGTVMAMFSAGAIGFWHAWGWFGYN